MIEKSGVRTVISEMVVKSQIKFLRSGFRDFARNDNASTNRAFNSLIIRKLQKDLKPSFSLVLNHKAKLSTQPFRNGKSFLFQELWIEEFGLITRSAVAEDGDNRFPRAQFFGQANCTSDVDP